MNVAVIADVHGNAVALDAVLAELDGERPDRTVCLGDVAAGPQPNDALDGIREAECPVVAGNADERLLSPGAPPEDEIGRRFHEIGEWSAARLDDDQLAFVRGFEPAVELPLRGGVRLSCYHGSPRSNTDGVDVTMRDEELGARFADVDSDLVAVGHTHTQFSRRYGEQVLFNPGSVGLPYVEDPETGAAWNAPWAEYAMVTQSADGLSVELRRTAVDVEVVVDATEASGMPHAEWWADEWRESMERTERWRAGET